jgi:hypothetical protein
MKKLAIILSVICAAGTVSLLAQNGTGGEGGSGGGGGGGGSGTGGGEGPGPVDPNQYSYSESWSKYFQYSYEHQNGTAVEKLGKEGAPATWNNRYQYQYGKPETDPAGEQVQNRFRKSEIPAETQNMIRQFQQDRVRLMKQLKTASDEERKEILKEMEQVRTRLREQVARLREQAQQQAEQMRHRFANERDRLLDQGAGGGNGGSRGGRDR